MRPHLLFMKVGTHAGEAIDDTMARKQREITVAGVAFWGYGGSTCHPVTKVQPFGTQVVKGSFPFVMSLVKTKKEGAPSMVGKTATEFSTDGKSWQPIPAGVSVWGSRYALVIRNLVPVQETLQLGSYAVALGAREGTPAPHYVFGRSDKACLRVRTDTDMVPDRELPAVLVWQAEVVAPYAVFVR